MGKSMINKPKIHCFGVDCNVKCYDIPFFKTAELQQSFLY